MNNYRGISIINTMQKILCKVLARRIASVNLNHGLIRKEQGGFIRREECIAQAATLMEILERRKMRKRKLLYCFWISKKRMI